MNQQGTLHSAAFPPSECMSLMLVHKLISKPHNSTYLVLTDRNSIVSMYDLGWQVRTTNNMYNQCMTDDIRVCPRLQMHVGAVMT